LNIPIDAIIEMNSKGFILGVEAELFKKTFRLPFYGPNLTPYEKGYIYTWEANLQTLDLMLL
jgi:hypothetical protein